jgi:hypothetical protein
MKIEEIEVLRRQMNNQLHEDTALVDISAMKSEYQHFEEFKNERPTEFEDMQRKYLHGAYKNYEINDHTEEAEYKMVQEQSKMRSSNLIDDYESEVQAKLWEQMHPDEIDQKDTSINMFALK